MKNIIIALTISVLLLVAAIVLPIIGKTTPVSENDNVSMVDGIQIIKIEAKGGYSPKNTLAKAGIPTKLVVKTNGSLDCSTALAIPSLGIRKNLPMSGEETFDIGIKQPGETLNGLCAMGMYGFQINFE